MLELVIGEDLSERLKRGALPVDEALDVARQIVQALEEAHDKGVVHRDLKPGNIKLGDDGSVKVLDFGLAKAFSVETESSSDLELSQSPTMARDLSRAGTILGTAAYMSPEQARGKTVDKRADIWAFGVVLFEMLTGRQLFAGETLSDTLAAVLKNEPDRESLPSDTPAPIRRLLARCLRKKPNERLRDIGDARLEIDEAFSADATPEVSAPKRTWLPWAVAGVFFVTTVGLALVAANLDSREPMVVRSSILPPPGTEFGVHSGGVGSPLGMGPPQLSPDGRLLAFTAQDEEGRSLLYVRALDADSARAIDGSDGVTYPFWSADGLSLGFFAEGKLRKVDATGGPVQEIADAPNGRGGTWNRDGVILFSPSTADVIYRVGASGGEPVAVTKREGGAGHRLPHFLPDGRRFLYFETEGGNEAPDHRVLIAALDDREPEELVRSSAGAALASDHLLFVNQYTLMVQAFDAESGRLAGEAMPLIDDVEMTPAAGTAMFSVSDNGLLVYKSASGDRRLEWVDRSGQHLGFVGDPASYQDVELSPDGARVVSTIRGDNGLDLWLHDLDRDVRSRFTFHAATDWSARFSPDGRTIAFSSAREGRGLSAIFVKDTNGTGEPELLVEIPEGSLLPQSWSSDGAFLALMLNNEDTGFDVWTMSLTSNRELSPLVTTPFLESNSRFSPDGRFVVYDSNESGRTEVYVVSFPDADKKWQVSTDGGSLPAWPRDGHEIVYKTVTGRVIAVAVETSDDGLEIGSPTPLFRLSTYSDVLGTSDAQKFLVISSTGEEDSSALTLVTNWPATLPSRR